MDINYDIFFDFSTERQFKEAIDVTLLNGGAVRPAAAEDWTARRRGARVQSNALHIAQLVDPATTVIGSALHKSLW